MRLALWPDSTQAEADQLITSGSADYLILVAVREANGLGGFLEVGARTSAEGCLSSPVAYLEGIWVDRDLRRTGRGLALVNEAKRWALSRGYSELASDCDINNNASESFHRAAGFTEVQRSVCFRIQLA